MSQILLIDDNPVQLRIRETVLRGANQEVSVTTTAESALALLRSKPGQDFRLVITDHIMPHVSGAEFVRLLRDVNPTIPVIVISGAADAESEYEGLNVTFRMKPLPPEELIAMVQSTLDRGKS